MLAVNEIVYRGENQNNAEHEASIIHSLGCDRNDRRKELEDRDGEQKAEGQSIDNSAESAQ